MKTVEITYRCEAGDASPRERPSDADAARRRLDEGSRAFGALLEGPAEEGGTARRIIRIDPRELGLLPGDRRAPEQRPYAAVLGCSDARVPIELIFNEGPNDLFVVRVAGNGTGSEVLGSLRYAIEHLGGSLKLIVVLGHSGCGAVSTAVDVFLNPAGYLSLVAKHALRSILDRLLVVVHASARKMSEAIGADVARRPGYREALIEMSIAMNAALAAYIVQQEIGGSDEPGVRAAYGVYLLARRQVWAPRGGSTECEGLADPPREGEAFRAFADALVRSVRIASLLDAREEGGVP